MTPTEQTQAAATFAKFWASKGDEKQETSRFWIDLLQNVLGIDNPAKYIEFEKRVKLSHTSFIDAYIPDTKVLIEQKGAKIDLHKAYEQSDGSVLTPYEQAKRYISEMKASEKPRWIVVCNFQEFLVYDLEKPGSEPEQIFLKDLEKEYYRLQFLVNQKNENIRREEEVSLQAGELVGKLYDVLIKQYINPNEYSLHSLNILCVRLVFCFYAEDAGLFASRTAFEDYIKSFAIENLRKGIIDLFKGLDTPIEDRDKYDTKLQPFPYVNGGLFAAEDIEIPHFTDEIVDVLCNHCAPFNWSEISPTIFGAVFESTLNPETRRHGGMHYTSIANIHKVIDPLFMDDLITEYNSITETKSLATQRQKLHAFQKKLGTLRILDPACGSGNFLTETYISLRRLENMVISVLNKGEKVLGLDNFIYVKISQLYGIEINDFAVKVAKTALWIAECQMMIETEKILGMNFDFLPLKTSANIIEGNALRLDWTTFAGKGEQMGFLFTDKLNVYKETEDDNPMVVCEPAAEYGNHYFKELNVVAKQVEEKTLPKNKKIEPVVYDYIIGNPPFVGARWMDKRQKEDTILTFGKEWQGVGNLDYVSCWYKKASDTIRNTRTRCAFVSTNSVSQGGAVINLWKPLFANGIHIDFAWQTFKWANETADKGNMAAVHCVIIGFSVAESNKPKFIFLNDSEKIEAKNINGYLLDAPNIFIEKRMLPLCNVPQICLGGQPIDDGNLTLTEEEKDNLLKKEPLAEKFIRPFMMGKDFIDRKPRYCLWLQSANPTDLRKCHEVMQRVEKVREFRLSSTRTSTLRAAEMPTLFGAPFECESDYVAIPKVSSENRRYIPMDFLSQTIIPGDKLFVMQRVSLYHLGVLTSSVHMAWMRAVCGRLEMRYSYSNTIVYNNFVWCNPTEKQKAKIEKTAQGIFDARALFPEASLADLYDETAMPPELRKAHRANDEAVLAAYGWPKDLQESEIVERLFGLYDEMVKGK